MGAANSAGRRSAVRHAAQASSRRNFSRPPQRARRAGATSRPHQSNKARAMPPRNAATTRRRRLRSITTPKPHRYGAARRAEHGACRGVDVRRRSRYRMLDRHEESRRRDICVAGRAVLNRYHKPSAEIIRIVWHRVWHLDREIERVAEMPTHAAADAHFSSTAGYSPAAAGIVAGEIADAAARPLRADAHGDAVAVDDLQRYLVRDHLARRAAGQAADAAVDDCQAHQAGGVGDIPAPARAKSATMPCSRREAVCGHQVKIRVGVAASADARATPRSLQRASRAAP